MQYEVGELLARTFFENEGGNTFAISYVNYGKMLNDFFWRFELGWYVVLTVTYQPACKFPSLTFSQKGASIGHRHLPTWPHQTFFMKLFEGNDLYHQTSYDFGAKKRTSDVQLLIGIELHFYEYDMGNFVKRTVCLRNRGGIWPTSYFICN